MRYLNALHIRDKDTAQRICGQLCNYIGGWWGCDEIKEEDGVYIIGTTAKWSKGLQQSAYHFIVGYLEGQKGK
jgi:hypothetical protein